MRGRLEHPEALSALRRRLLADLVVTGELDLPDPREGERVTRVEVEDRRGRGVGHVLVTTSAALTLYSVVGRDGLGESHVDVDGLGDPRSLALGGVSNAAVTRLHDLAGAPGVSLPAVWSHLGHLTETHPSWFADAPTLARWAASSSVAEVEAVERVLTALTEGAPLEWALRRGGALAP